MTNGVFSHFLQKHDWCFPCLASSGEETQLQWWIIRERLWWFNASGTQKILITLNTKLLFAWLLHRQHLTIPRSWKNPSSVNSRAGFLLFDAKDVYLETSSHCMTHRGTAFSLLCTTLRRSKSDFADITSHFLLAKTNILQNTYKMSRMFAEL